MEPVPIKWFREYPNEPVLDRTFAAFLPQESIGEPHRASMEEDLDRIIDDRFPDFRCFLADDWCFDEIERASKARVGHEYGGRKHKRIAEIVVRAVWDLERSQHLRHAHLPLPAVVDYWTSWQVQEHISRFCWTLGRSETAKILAGGNDLRASEQAEEARRFVSVQLASFANTLANDVNAPELLTDAGANTACRIRVT